MDITIVTEYSLWWVLLFSLISFLFVFWLYFFKKPYHKDLSLPKIYLLSFSRWLSMLLLLFLLLGPKFKYISHKIEKPILVFAQDNSKSLRLGKDSLFYLNEYPDKVEQLLQLASSKFNIQKISFGSKVEELTDFKYTATNTNLSELIEFLKTNYGDANNVQILLASDGLYNQGSNPRYLAQDLFCPIHTLQLGDTTQMEDISVYNVKTNDLGFVNNQLPVRVEVKANYFDKELVLLKISNGSKTLLTDQIQINSNSFFIEKDFYITPEKTGVQKFKVELIANKKEYSKANNQYEFVVDVLNTKRKIAICFDQYHPDIAAIKSVINENLNFSADLVNLTQKLPDLEDYNLLVLYQIPSKMNSYTGFLQQIKQKEIPMLSIVGGNSDLKTINELNFGFQFTSLSNQFTESVFKSSKNFTLFDLQIPECEILEKLPPLLSPFGNYEFNSEHQVLGFQSIKSIQTTSPQIAFSHRNNQKIAWVFGEGLWRWKLYSYRVNHSQKVFFDLINRMIQYLALNVKREPLIIKYAKDASEDNEIVFDAELYNESYELVNQAELDFVLTNQEGKSFNYRFDKQLKTYQLKINSLAKGNYSFAVATHGLKSDLKQTGQFIVSANNTEAKNLRADKEILSQISGLTGANTFTISNMSEIPDKISENNHSKSTLLELIKYGNLIEMLFIMIIIITLMILEWFLKKYWLGI